MFTIAETNYTDSNASRALTILPTVKINVPHLPFTGLRRCVGKKNPLPYLFILAFHSRTGLFNLIGSGIFGKQK